MEVKNRQESLIYAIECMSNDTLRKLYNKMVTFKNDFRCPIFDMKDFNEVNRHMSPSELVRSLGKNFNINQSYFRYNTEKSEMESEDFLTYFICNKEDYIELAQFVETYYYSLDDDIKKDINSEMVCKFIDWATENNISMNKEKLEKVVNADKTVVCDWDCYLTELENKN